MKSLLHPVLRIVGVAVAVALALRALFFYKAQWLWAQYVPAAPLSLTPWTRWAAKEHDGIEPYALLFMVAVASGATVVISLLIERLPSRGRVIAAALSVPALFVLAWYAPLRPPLSAVAATNWLSLVVVSASLLAAAFLVWRLRGRRGVPASLVFALAFVCFLPTTVLSRVDGQTIFAPTLNLMRGVPLREIYFQYDLLLSLLALVWFKIGATPMAFSAVGGLGHFLFMLGLLFTARRWFSRTPLLAGLLICVVVVRMYGCMVDASALPQVTPWRLDLWIIPLALTLVFGLDHWLVALALALLCFFCRSFGLFYLGAYGLALGAEFVAVRLTEDQPLLAALRAAVRRALPGLGLIVLSFVVGRLLFGSLTSEATDIYRRLGLGMMRIARESFYWWLLPLNATVVGLAFWRRASLPVKQRQAALFVSALAMANSIYFFGRSHESNLVNISAIFLLLFFLAIDLGWGLAETQEALVMRRFLRILPWCMVAFCAYFYAGKVIAKGEAQETLITTHHDLALAGVGDFTPNIDCKEIARAANSTKVVYFSALDFWFYWQCGNTSVGRYQPMLLAPMMDPLVQQLNQYLDQGYKIVVPRQDKDWSPAFNKEFIPRLGQLFPVETAKYSVYRRP